MGYKKKVQAHKGVFKAKHRHHRPYSRRGEAESTQQSEWRPRLTRQQFNKVAKPSVCGKFYKVVDADGTYGTARLLRPKEDTVPELTVEYLQKEEKTPEMRLVHQDRHADMWNAALSGHAAFTGRCDNPKFLIDTEQQKGICWKQQLKCENCQYKGKMFKLYDEVQSTSRGAKAARPNRGWQVALQETPVGNTKSRYLLIGANVPPPSRSGMNRAATHVGSLTSTVISEELRKERLQLKETNRARGLPADAAIAISTDCRYNSTVISSRKKPGQNASQAIGIVIEQQTSEKKIVAAYMENKLCWIGAHLRNKGFAVHCPGGHEGCTATAEETEPLSELRIGEKLGDMFVRDGIPIKYVTTDGDARSAEGFQIAMQKMLPDFDVIRKADPVHLGQAQIRQTMSAVFSDGMFPGRTQEHKKEQQKVLARDIQHRSHAIFAQMWQQHAGDIRPIARYMPGVVKSTIACYDGDCSNCRKSSVVCAGGKKTCWWRRSVQLNTGVLNRGDLNMTDTDRALLTELLNLKLGKAALQLLDQNTNTCKNEAANRSISASLPKNSNFGRTGKARMLATCDRLNKGPGNSLVFKLAALGAPIGKGGRVAAAARGVEVEHKYQREYKKRRHVQQQTRNHKFAKQRSYNLAKAKRQDDRGRYSKGQLDPKVDMAKVRAANNRLIAEQRRRLRQAKATSKEQKQQEKADKSKTKQKKNTTNTKTTYDRKDDHTYAY